MFAYDDLNRLTTANSGTSLWGTATDNGYSYDAMGNIQAIQLGTGRKDAFTYKAGGTGNLGLPEIASVIENGSTRTLSYDAFGNEQAERRQEHVHVRPPRISPAAIAASSVRTTLTASAAGFQRC